jgi:hypothetical protein
VYALLCLLPTLHLRLLLLLLVLVCTSRLDCWFLLHQLSWVLANPRLLLLLLLLLLRLLRSFQTPFCLQLRSHQRNGCQWVATCCHRLLQLPGRRRLQQLPQGCPWQCVLQPRQQPAQLL